MPTITVVLQKAQADGTMMTRCYPNAEAHINPRTHVLEMSRRDVLSRAGQAMLAAFPSETYRSWEEAGVWTAASSRVRRLRSPHGRRVSLPSEQGGGAQRHRLRVLPRGRRTPRHADVSMRGRKGMRDRRALHI